MTAISHQPTAISRTDEEIGHAFNRSLRCREADALQRLLAQRLQAFEAQREMRATFVSDERVNFIDDHCLGFAERGAAFHRGQQQVQRLRCRDQDVWRLADERRSL